MFGGITVFTMRSFMIVTRGKRFLGVVSALVLAFCMLPQMSKAVKAEVFIDCPAFNIYNPF